MEKPLNVLNKSLNKKVLVELKANREYRGVLGGYDPHMNLVLKNAEEFIDREIIDEFIHQISEALNDNSMQAIEARVTVARENTWDQRVGKIYRILQPLLYGEER